MKELISTFTFTVPLSPIDHNLAQKYSQLQNSAAKAKQVYLNILAVCAVNFYLQCLSIETNLLDSDSFNPLLLKSLDVADISLPQLGQLECRPVLPNAENLDIPPDVYSDRIGYVAVKLSHSLQQAVILGFTTTASAQIPLAQLRSLEEFPEYLHQLKQSVSRSSFSLVSKVAHQPAIKLSDWFEGVVAIGWQTVETLIKVNYAQPVVVRDMEQPEKKVKRAKAIDLGIQLGKDSVVLALALTTQPDDTINVLVQIYPSSGTLYLPKNLKLKMLSPSGKILQETVSGSLNNYTQLRRFSGQQGDLFRLEITLDEVTVQENFVL
ncbi:conserved hypothetical protein [Hyella patelloides LEGE 07179]|uniref:DUF1822 family protein n=1 Tax=Hyella patelloides LEGE 07179 TaxID=945734 RepID=A0A563VSJ9_9CYAN|nr:DUF1822 family protein [Hyella patelloides]VEP14383.1 conserved hypothetical protein [Hyella patelloides LEGE 07179]